MPLACILVLASAGLATAQTPPAGVIGSDDRKLVEETGAPWNAVGRINIASKGRLRHCTGTLVAPNLVITAAHCLLDPYTTEPVNLDTIHFLPGARRDKYLAHGRARCLKFMDSFLPGGGGGVPAREDVALIVTRESLDVPPAEPLGDGAQVGADTPLVYGSYFRDRPYMLSADTSCHTSQRDTSVWTTDCDTNYGGSGGPVFVMQDGKLRIAAIMVGFVKGRYSVAVPAPRWRSLLQKATCN